jgi:hypothetical protein
MDREPTEPVRVDMSGPSIELVVFQIWVADLAVRRRIGHAP